MQIIIPVIIHNEKNTTGINVSFAIKLINHPSLTSIDYTLVEKGIRKNNQETYISKPQKTKP